MNDELLASAPSNGETSSAPERRHGISDLERASLLLSHAVQYLSLEQRAGRCTSVRSNRQAITTLCECAETLTELEHREYARETLADWLADARQS